MKIVLLSVGLLVLGLTSVSAKSKDVQHQLKEVVHQQNEIANKKAPVEAKLANPIVAEPSSALKSLLLKNATTRVIQGDQSYLSYGPYVVSIGVNGHLCSGVILGTTPLQWVLTTAGCVAGLPEKLIRIRYNSEHPNFGGRIAQADYVVTHPSFNRRTMLNDIALIRTTEPLAYTSYRTQLPSQGEFVSSSTELRFLGWGVQTEESGQQSPFLRLLLLNTLSESSCSSNYATVGMSVSSGYHLCAGDLYNGGKGFCTGDVGGPLYYWSSDKIYGLASFSAGCGRPGYPPVFTRVSNYRYWIDQTIGGSSSGTTSYPYQTTANYPWVTDGTTGWN